MDPIPTHAEAIHAALVVSHYTIDKADPILWEVEPALVSFRWQDHILGMRDMKDSKITFLLSATLYIDSIILN